MNFNYKNIVKTTFGVGFFIVIIVVLVQLNSGSKKYSSSPDLQTFLDNAIESGITNKSFDKDDPLLKNRQILISSSINENVAKEVTSKLLYLDSINHDSISVLISSNGGWGNCARQIIEMFGLIKSPVNTIAVGYCYSSASLILVSATGRRFAAPNTLIMIHANLAISKEEQSQENYYNHWYEDVWKNSTNIPSKWYPMTNDKEYYLNTDDAIKYKVIDQVKKKL